MHAESSDLPCPRCGRFNYRNQKLCRGCGHDLHEPRLVPPVLPASSEPVFRSMSRESVAALALTAFLLLVLVVIVSSVVTGSSGSDNHHAGPRVAAEPVALKPAPPESVPVPPLAELEAAVTKRAEELLRLATNSTPPQQPLPSARPLLPEPLPLPPHGTGKFNYRMKTAKSSLEIIPSRSETEPFVVKVENATDRSTACWFIVNGASFRVKIPPGDYRISFGSGSSWYGESNWFGAYGTYSVLENNISIPSKTIYNIHLEPSYQGTLRQHSVSLGAF